MSYIRKKILRSGKVAAYKIVAKWDREKRQSRSVSTYLGMVDDAGNIVPKGTRKKPHRPKTTPNSSQEQPKEKLILDFGNAYLVSEFIKRSSIYEPLRFAIEARPEILPLMTYRICDPGPMYNCQTWLEGTVLHAFLHKAPSGIEHFPRRISVEFWLISATNLFSENFSKIILIERRLVGRAEKKS